MAIKTEKRTGACRKYGTLVRLIEPMGLLVGFAEYKMVLAAV
ncbi:MAG: hypothetical protein ABL984_10495 [Pyrinomonadaceae bacterium]